MDYEDAEKVLAGMQANGEKWVMGGCISGTSRFNDVWSSVDGRAWTQEPNAGWSARFGHRAVVFENGLWVMGGYDGGYPNDVWVLNGVPNPEVCPGTPVNRPTALFGEPTSEGHIDVTLRLPEGHQLSEYILPLGVVTSDADIRAVGVAGPNGGWLDGNTPDKIDFTGVNSLFLSTSWEDPTWASACGDANHFKGDFFVMTDSGGPFYVNLGPPATPNWDVFFGKTGGLIVADDKGDSIIAFCATDYSPGCPDETGTLNVTISPAGAVSAGAMWSLDAAATMYASGETVTLATGSHVVKFTDVADWTKPADIPVTTRAGQETDVTGTYRLTFTWGDLATASGATPSVACNRKPGGQDAALVLKYYAGILDSLEGCPDGTVYASPVFPPGSDVNGDGQLGGQDAAYILKFYAGLINCFPVDTNCDGNEPETP